MGDFVSWTDREYIDEKTGKPGKAIMFLTDSDVFDTKRGKEMLEFSGSQGDAIGHGGLCYYYEINPHSIPHRECTDLTSPDNIPEEIANAIRAGKMDRLMKFARDHQYRQLLRPDVFKNVINYDSMDFLPHVAQETRDDITHKLRRIIDTKESEFGAKTVWPHKRQIGNILARFRWTDTKEGFNFWYDVSCHILVNTNAGGYFDYERFIKLWKVESNRADAWRTKLTTRQLAQKGKRIRKAPKVISARKTRKRRVANVV